MSFESLLCSSKLPVKIPKFISRYVWLKWMVHKIDVQNFRHKNQIEIFLRTYEWKSLLHPKKRCFGFTLLLIDIVSY